MARCYQQLSEFYQQRIGGHRMCFVQFFYSVLLLPKTVFVPLLSQAVLLANFPSTKSFFIETAKVNLDFIELLIIPLEPFSPVRYAYTTPYLFSFAPLPHLTEFSSLFSSPPFLRIGHFRRGNAWSITVPRLSINAMSVNHRKLAILYVMRVLDAASWAMKSLLRRMTLLTCDLLPYTASLLVVVDINWQSLTTCFHLGDWPDWKWAFRDTYKMAFSPSSFTISKWDSTIQM